MTSENDQGKLLLACIHRFSRYPTIEVPEKSNGPIFVEYLDEYIQFHV